MYRVIIMGKIYSNLRNKENILIIGNIILL